MRTSLRVVLSLVLVSGVSLPARALVLLTEENPPLNFTRQGKVEGIGTAVVSEMVSRAGLKADIRVLPWAEAYAKAQSDADTCVFSTARFPARMPLFLWVGPIARGTYSVFGLPDFADKIGRVDDLKRYRIGAVDDARGAYLVQRQMNVVKFKADRDIPPRLTTDPSKADGVDLWVSQAWSAKDVARAAGVPEVKEVFSAILSQDYWLACSKQVPADQIRGMQKVLQEMIKDGTQRRLTQLPR